MGEFQFHGLSAHSYRLEVKRGGIVLLSDKVQASQAGDLHLDLPVSGIEPLEISLVCRNSVSTAHMIEMEERR